jgi:hypothetical protein
MKPLLILFAAALPMAAFTASPPAEAAQYTIFVYETEADFAVRDTQTPQAKAYWDAYADFAVVLQSSGAIRGGAPLMAPSTARTIRSGSTTVSQGAYAASGLHLGGYFQIEAPTMDEALKLAGRAPAVARGGAVEVRETYPAPAMAGQ